MAHLHGADTSGDGTFDVLYLHTDDESVVYVCDPAGAGPSPVQLVEIDPGGSAYGMGFDRTNNVLWTYDDDIDQFVSMQ